MIRTSINRILLTANCGLCLSSLTGMASAAPTYAPPTSSPKPKSTNIGGIRISHYRGFNTTSQFGAVEFKGPGIIVESRDAAQPTQFRLLTDNIVVKRTTTNAKTIVTADLTGNIRYTITQKTKQGVRTVQGTAGHAAYSDSAQRIYLTQGVQATLTDEAQLEGPATLRSNRSTIPTDRSERYEMEGAPDSNDVRFTPRRKGKAKDGGPAQPIAGAPIHLHAFRTCEIEMGRSVVAQGERTIIDFTDPVENSVGSLTAGYIAADYGQTITHAEARGNVDFRYESPDSKGARQSLTGQSDSAIYTADMHRLTVTGNVAAELRDPTHLLEPGHLTAGQVTVHTAEPNKEDKRQAPRVIYEISGAPARTSLVFRPRPNEERRDQQPAANRSGAPANGAPSKPDRLQGFAVGIVSVTGFDKGTFEPGQNAVLIGDGSTYRTEDREAHTSSSLRASRLTATFATDQTLQRLEALGNVRFEAQQPATVNSARDADAQPQPAGAKPAGSSPAIRLQTIKATATRAVFTNTPEGQILTVPGPWKTSTLSGDPDETKPATTSGEKGDTLTWNITTNALDVDSPNGTAVMESPITEKKQTAEAKQPAKQPSKKPDR